MSNCRCVEFAIVAAALVCLLSVGAGCDREPTAKDTKAMVSRIAGEYGLEDLTPVGGIYGTRAGVKEPSAEYAVHWREPRLIVSADGTFEMRSLPAQWLCCRPEQVGAAVSAKGTWVLGDDGDGSWQATLTITQIEGDRPPMLLFLLRPGDPTLLGICTFDRKVQFRRVENLGKPWGGK